MERSVSGVLDSAFWDVGAAIGRAGMLNFVSIPGFSDVIEIQDYRLLPPWVRTPA